MSWYISLELRRRAADELFGGRGRSSVCIMLPSRLVSFGRWASCKCPPHLSAERHRCLWDALRDCRKINHEINLTFCPSFCFNVFSASELLLFDVVFTFSGEGSSVSLHDGKKEKNVRHHLRFENKAGDEARVFLFFQGNSERTLNISTNWYCFVIFHFHTKVTVPPGPKKRKKNLSKW